MDQIFSKGSQEALSGSTDLANSVVAKYFNPHIVYVKTHIATIEQLREAIRKALIAAEELLDREIRTEFRINYLKRYDGIPYGYGYLWFTNTEAASLLLGKNADGSERIEYKDDPNWVPPSGGAVKESPRSQRSPDFDNFLSDDRMSSWADEVEQEESRKCPKIAVKMPPLVTLGKYRISAEQKRQLEKLIAEKGLKITTIPDEDAFRILPAYVTAVDDAHNANVLFSKNVPDWVTADMLKKEIAHYVTDSRTTFNRKVHGMVYKETYPVVTITAKRFVYVNFDPATRDAQFARLMIRKITLGTDATLVFDHPLY